MPFAKIGSINIHYETYGEGEPLLLIMGFGLPGSVWVPMLPMFTGFKCIYFDNRGTGQSDKPDGSYSISEMAEDALGVLRAVGISKAKVFGVSMGGMIAQELTLRHPETVEKLVLGCTWAGGPTAKQAAPEVIANLMAATAMMRSDPSKAMDLLLPILFPSDFVAAHPELKSMFLAGLSMGPQTPPQTGERQAAGIMQFNAYDRLPQIKCPVLIVHGDKDVLVPPENAQIIKSRIPHAELSMVHGGGHAFQSADPIGVHQKIVSWLRS
jgi:pimeloyl-ACP methyl ester carboxylesterase